MAEEAQLALIEGESATDFVRTPRVRKTAQIRQTLHLHQELLEERTQLVNNDQRLLRGAPFSRVVACCGDLLEPKGTIAASSGAASSEDTFQFSMEVRALDYFISHSWRDSGRLKWLTLLWTKNWKIALVASNLVGVILLLAGLFFPHWRPVRGFDMGPPIGKIDMGWSGVVQPAAFLFLILFGSFFQEEMLFLDKVCIHQTDEELKAAGIRSLGAFLKHSNQLLVLWGDDYFDRLWCCYELAVYMLLHGTEQVKIVPVELALLGIAIPCCCLLNCLLIMMSTKSSADGQVVAGIANMVIFPLSFAFAGAFKGGHYAARQRLKVCLSNFEVRHAQCFCCFVGHKLEDGTQIQCDREFVESSIQEWYGTYDTDGLDEFDNITRGELLQVTAEMLGPETIMSTDIMTVMIISVLWINIDFACNSWAHNSEYWSRSLLSTIPFSALIVVIDQMTGAILAKAFSSFGPAYLQTIGACLFFLLFEVTSIGLLFPCSPSSPWLEMILVTIASGALLFLARLLAW